MNSCTSILLAACAPPLRMFIIGTGRTSALTPPKNRYRGRPSAFAAARALARETAKIAFAPSRDLSGVPSRRSMAVSISPVWEASMPVSAAHISVLIFFTARSTPFPPKRAGSASRSSKASNCPVEAPLGTAAVPLTPFCKRTTASTVGFPRESIISRP